MQALDSISLDKVIDILDRLDFFHAFSEQEKERLASSHGKFFAVQTNEAIIKEGDLCDTMYVLISGEVEVYKGRSRETLAKLGPGDIFGEISFLTKTERISSCRAMQQSIVLELNPTMMNGMESEVREKIKDKIILKLIKRLDMMNARLYEQISYKTKD